MYEEFGEIINTMKFNSYDYTENITITLNALNDRKNGKNYSLSDHICSMVFALLSNQRPWKHIADNQEKIKTLFNNFDVDFIKKPIIKILLMDCLLYIVAIDKFANKCNS